MKKGLSQIALLGTSADPPTCGHQALLESLLTLFPKVVTWASDNPMKSHQASLEKRCELLMALVETIANADLEIRQDISSPWTIKSLEKASKCWPNSELIFIVGSDLVEQIPKWIKAKSIFQLARIGIAPREGWPIKTSTINHLKSMGGRIDLLPLKIPASSSTNIRNNSEYSQIPKGILPILRKQDLYKISKISS